MKESCNMFDLFAINDNIFMIITISLLKFIDRMIEIAFTMSAR